MQRQQEQFLNELLSTLLERNKQTRKKLFGLLKQGELPRSNLNQVITGDNAGEFFLATYQGVLLEVTGFGSQEEQWRCHLIKTDPYTPYRDLPTSGKSVGTYPVESIELNPERTEMFRREIERTLNISFPRPRSF